MTIAVGTKLGTYAVLSPLGAGGMGEVYRAHDSKLGRDVALKVLPVAFARDSDRMARFEREAKVLASLNHPHIASIYGLEDSGATRALVMELVEGPTLADRIRSGAIPLDESLRIAKQISEALEYAHEHGIVHRDLKPANVKVNSDDAVKVLDFGLAKAIEGDTASVDISTSPTMSRMATMAGILLGTAAYMSPEQAKAKPVDRRADIWAFGCVLFEMLTGKAAFRGETVTDTLASVIKEDPDWSLLPSNTPVRVRVLLQRCLQKDPKQRLQAIGDARIALEEVLSGVPDPIASGTSQSWRNWLGWGIAGLAVASTAVLALLLFHHEPAPPARTVRFDIPLPERTPLRGSLALSPDGSKLAFVAGEPNGQNRVWLRSLDTLDARPLDGTEGPGDLGPFWSPDGRFIVFYAANKLMKVDVSGGPPVLLCDSPSFVGGAWNRDDQIVFGSTAGIMQVSAAGGSASPVITSGLAAAPEFLPDGRHFIYAMPPISTQGKQPGIYVGSLDAKPDQSPKRLLADITPVRYVSSPGHPTGYLVFVRSLGGGPGATGPLMAQPFDPQRLEFTGDAVPIAESVPNTGFSASSSDVLAYATSRQLFGSQQGLRGVIQGQLAWFDREGKSLGTFGDPGAYRSLTLSPDGKRIAFERADPQKPAVDNIWLYEFARGVTTRFSFSSALDSTPIWSPDGSRIVFTSNRGGGQFELYQKTSNMAGDEEPLFESPNDSKNPSGWSPDGRFLLYFNPVPPDHLWLLPLTGGEADRKPVRVDNSSFNEAVGRFSPDGRWIAYSSDESGRNEIYVRPFDAASTTGSLAGKTPVSGKWMVSKDGGGSTLWRRDGKELFYISPDGTAMAVDVNTNGVFQAGIPKPLFKVPTGVLFWDISPDGKRFVMALPSTESTNATSKLTVTLNWQSALKK